MVYVYVWKNLLTVWCGSVAKHLESANTVFSFIWWILGFYWVTAGGESLIRDSPQLYWFVWANWPFYICFLSSHLCACCYLVLIKCGLFCRICITFLALDVVFVVICIAVASLIGIAVCFCLPCIIAILYVVTDQVGAHRKCLSWFQILHWGAWYYSGIFWCTWN